MKRLISVVLSLLLIVSAAMGALADGKYIEYKDEVYSFRYPTDWKRGTAKDGTVALRIPGGDDGVMTFAFTTDLFRLTGDAKEDEAFVKAYIKSNGGKISSRIQLDGKFEMLECNGLHGFRAFGKADGKQSVEMVMLTAESSMIAFVFVGKKAISEEEAILSSVNVTGKMMDEETGDEAYKRWKGGGFSLLYPKEYGTMEQKDGTVFVEKKAKNDMIMARTYTLKAEYSEDQAMSIAKAKLPKSTHVKADPKMMRVGDWNAAVITGNTKAGPMAFYIIGSGRTALALMFLGKEAIGHAEKVLGSVTFGE